MSDMQFFEYVSMLLKEAGHMVTSEPVYINHSSNEALYIDSNKNVIVSDIERTLLSSVSNISLILEIEWDGIIDEPSEKIQFFSITVHVSDFCRSQDIADIHQLIQKFWICKYSIVFFKSFDKFVVSFADNYKSPVLSDWFDIREDYEAVIARLSVENILLETINDYFEDCIYALAREYYLHPISFEKAYYEMMPTNLLEPKLYFVHDYVLTDEITKDDVKAIIQNNLMYYDNIYGDDLLSRRMIGLKLQRVVEVLPMKLNT